MLELDQWCAAGVSRSAWFRERLPGVVNRFELGEVVCCVVEV